MPVSKGRKNKKEEKTPKRVWKLKYSIINVSSGRKTGSFTREYSSQDARDDDYNCFKVQNMYINLKKIDPK
jgi:hypothetical protein